MISPTRAVNYQWPYCFMKFNNTLFYSSYFQLQPGSHEYFTFCTFLSHQYTVSHCLIPDIFICYPLNLLIIILACFWLPIYSGITNLANSKQKFITFTYLSYFQNIWGYVLGNFHKLFLMSSEYL